MNIDVDLYGKFKYVYAQQKMSQRAIAKELGISRNTVREYCGGGMYPGNVSHTIGNHRLLQRKFVILSSSALPMMRPVWLSGKVCVKKDLLKKKEPSLLCRWGFSSTTKVSPLPTG